MEKIKKIAIVGCGWLGKQIGTHFHQLDWEVFASFRREQHSRELLNLDFIPFELQIDENGICEIIDSEKLQSVDVLLLSIPPIRKELPGIYVKGLLSVVQQIVGKSKVIFISSTGVYPHKEGIFDENYSFLEQEKKNVIYQAEIALNNLLGDRLTIIRSGGLIGPERHPIKQLSGREIASNGSAPVSLIHSKDVCRAVQWIIEKKVFGEVLNLIYPSEKSKKQYYEMIAERYGIEPPVFIGSLDVNRKIRSIVPEFNPGILLENIEDYSQPFHGHYVK